MFQMQYDLQAKLGIWEKLEAREDLQQQYLNQMFLAMHEETCEIMRTTAYKNPLYVPFGWKKGQEHNREEFLDECVDLLYFLMNIVLAQGFNAEDFYEAYCRKNNLNYVRQESGY